MSRTSISARMARLDARGHDLETAAQLGPTPTVLHERTVEVLTELMSMGTTLQNRDTPTHLKVMMRTLQQARPMLLDGLVALEPERIRAFMTELRDRINSIVEAPMDAGEAERVAAEHGSDIAGSDIA